MHASKKKKNQHGTIFSYKINLHKIESKCVQINLLKNIQNLNFLFPF